MSFTAKSVILDIADTYLGPDPTFPEMGLRQVDFWHEGAKITIGSADVTCYEQAAASYDDPEVAPVLAFDTSTSKTGWNTNNGWRCGTDTNNRLICVFDSSITFDEIRVNNFHSSGGSTDLGAKNVVINISTDAITDTTYNASIANSTKVFDGQFDEHVASNVEDEQLLDTASGTGHFISTNTLTGAAPYEAANVGHFTTTNTLTNTGKIVGKVLFVGHFTTTSALNCSAARILPPLNRLEPERPMFEMEAFAGAWMESTLPELELSAVGTASKVGGLNASLSSWSMTAEAGGYIKAEIPVFTLDMIGNVTREGVVEARIPLYQLAMTGSKARISGLDITKPALTTTMTAIGGQVGSIDASFLMFYSTMSAIGGSIGGITATLPTLRCRISGIHTGDNDLEATLPMIYIDISSGTLETEVLRYVREKIR